MFFKKFPLPWQHTKPHNQCSRTRTAELKTVQTENKVDCGGRNSSQGKEIVSRTEAVILTMEYLEY